MAFLSQLKWQDWVTIFSLVFGIITLIAYLDQRRSGRGTAVLTKWAERNLDKSISEEQIRGLLAQKAAMEEQITRIPALARAAVLQEQARLHEQAISEHISIWQTIRQELQSEAAFSGLDPQLRQAIFDHIFPRYMRHERRDRLRTRVTVLSVALAALSAVLPYPLNTAFGLLLAVPLLYAGARLYALNEDAARAFRVLQPWFHLGYAAVAAALLIIGGFLTFYSKRQLLDGYAGKVLMATGLALAPLYFLVRKRIDQFVTRLCSIQSLLSSNDPKH